ncbi:MAG: DUF6788 family protein [Candidatus Heimdallarchaeaceae archaeon]
MINNDTELLLNELRKTERQIENQIYQLSLKDPIFGLISAKFVKCGKKNCRCARGGKYRHGPYYYLRQEPDFNFRRYLGKKIPKSIEQKIEIGREIKRLEKEKRKIEKIITALRK